MSKIGVYWGRFNPPHKGHISLIEKLSRKVGLLYVVVGSAQEKNTLRNPFSGNERKRMLQEYVKEKRIKNVKVFVLNDKKKYSDNITDLIKKTHADILFTDKKIIANASKNRLPIGSYKRKGNISATKVREAIAKGTKWENLTGKSVVRLIKKFDGINRIKKLFGVKL